MNLYAFVGNNALNAFDLLGLACCRITVVIELANPNHPSKMARKGLDGHTGIAIGNDFYDFGPQPGEGGDYWGSAGRRWWPGIYTRGRSTLDAMRRDAYPRLENPVYEVSADVCTDDCLRLREYWKKFFEDTPRYFFYGTQCTSSVCRGLVASNLLDGSTSGINSPENLLFQLWSELKNTCGPNAGKPATIKRMNLGLRDRSGNFVP